MTKSQTQVPSRDDEGRNDDEIEKDLNDLLQKHGYGSLSQLTSRFGGDGGGRISPRRMRSSVKKRPLLKRSDSSGLFFRNAFPDSPSDSDMN